MKQKKIKLVALFLFGLIVTGINAQETITASGGEATGDGSASYTVGQVFYQTHTGDDGSVAEGVQQPYEISVVVSIEEAAGINLSLSAYPNPTKDFLTLEINDYDSEKLSYKIYDINGKLIDNRIITDNQISIDMSNLVSAVYFLSVIDNNKEIKNFKIIKN